MSRNKLNITKNYNITTTNSFVSTNFEPGNTIHQLFDGIIPAVDSTGEDMLKINNADSYGQIELTAKANSPGDIINEIVIHLATARPLNIFAMVRAEGGGTNLENVAIGAAAAGPNSLKFSNPNTPIREILIGFSAAAFQNTNFCLIGEIEFFGSDRTPNFEFNDSVLSTKAWNSSRYDGKQLKGTLLNKYNSSNDISYGKTPVLQRYTRNIYIGNTIFGGEPGANDSEDILGFPGNSYITSTNYLTINDDDSITESTIENFEDNDLTNIKGYSKTFVDDFEVHSRFRIQLLDESVSHNLKNSYKIITNIGLLKKVIEFKPVPGNILGISGGQTSSYSIQCIVDSSSISNHKINLGATPPEGGIKTGGAGVGDPEIRYNSGMTVDTFSSQELNKFYTGSFFGTAYTLGQVAEDELGFVNQGGSQFVSGKKLFEFNGALSRYANLASSADVDSINYKLKANRRYFATFCESGSSTPLVLGRTGSLSGSFIVNSFNEDNRVVNGDLSLADFSTGEIAGASSQTGQGYFLESISPTVGDNSYGNDGFEIPSLQIKNGTLRQSYVSNDVLPQLGGDVFLGSFAQSQEFNSQSLAPELFATGSLIISRADITSPTILAPLKKTEDLPNGVGDKPFILIPQNLHPFIKDNLTHFLMKAGLDTGDRKVLPEIKEKYRNLF